MRRRLGPIVALLVITLLAVASLAGKRQRR